MVAEPPSSLSLSLTLTRSWWLRSIPLIVQCFVLRIRLCSGSFCTPIVAFFLCRFSDDWLVNSLLQIYRSHIYSTTLRCRFFSEKSIEKKHFCRHDKNYHYFWKSNIPVINLIVDSRNKFRKIGKMSGKIVCFLNLLAKYNS